MSFVGSIAILDSFPRLWDCMKGPAASIYKLEETLTSLRNEWQELKAVRNDLKRKVEIAEQQQMTRLDVVDTWLSMVEAMENEVDELITQSDQQVQNKCLGGCCPKNCWSSYKLGKKVAKKLEDVKSLRSKGDFSQVADIHVPSMDEIPGSSTVGLESTFDKVWRCLVEEEVGIIGLYGMGGVGKTTLLTQINNELLKSNLDFGVVIWVVVSKDINEEKVQNEIGKRLGFHEEMWKAKSREEKGMDIFRVLKQKKFVLLLDDIWERVDLLKLGVPLTQKDKNGSKLVFTTRSANVCGNMEAHKRIKVECLAQDKALDLFKEKVGEDTLNSHPKLPGLAATVARECKGLPLALITVGRAMASKKTEEEWSHAITTLRGYAAEFSGMTDEVYGLLRFSYDSLSGEKLQFCFLYFSLFPEDYLIYKDYIIKIWIGEGILGENESIKDARNRGHDIIGTLINACLLEFVDESSVRMHDVIRDMALWIIRECKEVEAKFFLQSRIIAIENDDGKWRQVERLSMIGSRIEQLNISVSWPNLSTLILRNCGLKRICSDFFQSMPCLKVLDMSWNDLSELPLGISKVDSLEYLDFSYTGIGILSAELKNLNKLKHLDLQGTVKLGMIPPQLLSGFHMMHVLNVYSCGKPCNEIVAGNVLAEENEGLLLDELECLERLQEFHITLKSNSALQRILKSHKFCDCTESLLLRHCRGTTSLDLSFLLSLKNLDTFSISRCGDLVAFYIQGKERTQNIFYNSHLLNTLCFENLQQFFLTYCPGVKDLTWLIYVPNLQILYIKDCEELEEIIHPKVVNFVKKEKLSPLSKLQVLEIVDVPKLRSIYSGSLGFPCLREMYERGCPKLKRLPVDSSSFRFNSNDSIRVHGDRKWWDELEWEDEAIRSRFSLFFPV